MKKSTSTNGQNSQLALYGSIKLTYINTILNLNGLNAPVKRYRQANWIKSQNPSIYCIQTHLTCKDTQRLKRKEWRKIYQPNGEEK